MLGWGPCFDFKLGEVVVLREWFPCYMLHLVAVAKWDE